MSVVRTYVARSTEELDDINAWVEEAAFDLSGVQFDAGEGVLAIPFEQEEAIRGLLPEESADDPGDRSEEDFGLPPTQFVRSTRRFSEYRQPFFRCILRIAAADRVKVTGRSRGRHCLSHLEYDAERRVVVASVLGRLDVRAWVRELHVELDVTDEVLAHYRRRYGASWASTGRRTS